MVQYLQRPQGDMYVPVDAIWTEHWLLGPSGEGENGLLSLQAQKLDKSFLIRFHPE